MTEVEDRLDEAFAAPAPWGLLVALAAGGGEDLIPALRRRYQDDSARRDLIAWLLRSTPGGAALAGELLPGRAGSEANDSLVALASGKGACPAPELRRLLADDATRATAVAVAGLSGHQELVPELVSFLDDPRLAGATAMALGRLGANAHDLVRRLSSVEGLTHSAFVVALELMHDPAAVPGLLARLEDAPDTAVFDLHHALVRLTGRDPLVPLSADLAGWAVNVRQTWQSVSMSAEPTLSGPELDGPTLAEFTLDQGLGAITTDYDPPSPTSSWPRWDKTVQALGHPLYQAGSDCDTCEAFLSHLGWPPDRAISAAGQLRTALADVPALTTGLLAAMTSMLEGLRTGHYQLRLADLDIERVTEPAASWLERRLEFRDGVEPDGEPDAAGVEHFQLRRPMPGRTPSFGVFLPTQPLDALSRDTVDAHLAAIEDGARPAAILLAWVADRYVSAEHEERMVFGLVLDGHHKLAAHAEAGIPARTVLVHRLEDTPAAVLDELTWP